MRATSTQRRQAPGSWPNGEPRPGATRVLVVGGSQQFIQDVTSALEGKVRLSVVGGAENREEAIERAVLLRPDVIVLDINTGHELGGVDTAFAVRRVSPATAFVLISPYDDPERLSMVPRGLGIEWSYLLTETAKDGDQLADAIQAASWAIPLIDSKIDSSLLGALQDVVDQAILKALGTRHVKRSAPRRINDWRGSVQTIRIPDPGSAEWEGS